jgi:excisionase family DNA binding protein
MALTFNEIPEAISQINEKLQNLESLIRSNSSTSEKEDQLLTIEEAGKFLNLKKATIYGLVCRRAIPCLKPGKKLFFSKQALNKWIVDRNQKSIYDFDLGNKKRGK